MKIVPRKSESTIPAEDAIYLHIYVHKDTKKQFQKIFNAWQNQQIDKDSDETSRNYFFIDALECLKNSRGLKINE